MLLSPRNKKVLPAILDTLSILRDLSGTPLRSIFMNYIHSEHYLDRKLDLKILSILNIRITHLVIENSAVGSLDGQLSQIQPSWTSLTFSLSSNYDDVAKCLLDAVLFMPNLQSLKVYGYPNTAVFIIDKDIIVKFFIDNINIYFKF